VRPLDQAALLQGSQVFANGRLGDAEHLDQIGKSDAPVHRHQFRDARLALVREDDLLVSVHLMVTDADSWIGPFAEAGAGMLTVHAEACSDVKATLARIEALGVQPALAVGVDDPLESVWPLLDRVDRVLLMGTRLGIKGVGIDPTIYARIQATVEARSRSTRRPEVYVDGGIRRDIVPSLAQAGADGVTPGSLVFGDADPAAAVQWIAAQE
jgi:ribulose-phosphate 3-epimerase